MNCPHCGNPVETGAQFCPKCYACIEPPNLLQRLVSFFQRLPKTGPIVLTSKRTAKITFVDKDGNRREYKSLDEVPLEMRSQIEQLQAEAMKEEANLLSPEVLAKAEGKPGVILQKSFKVYKIKDADGQEHVYHSLDELPPNVQAALQRLQVASGPIMWRGKKVQVRASLVPRYLWSSASIDVYLDGECVFRTGGKMNLTGSHSAAVRVSGSEYQMEVTWQRSRNFCFPYQLRIGGELVADSQVRVENQQMMLVPVLIIFGIMLSIAVGLNQFLKIFWPHLNGG